VTALDGVRGLAALAVGMHHCLYTGLPSQTWPWHVRLLQALSAHLDLGVDLFFVLSGYLITSLLLLARRRPNYYHNFYWKRAFRILPALILVLVITHSMGVTPWYSVVTALLFVANLTTLWNEPENGPFWSLSIEEQFYLLWPTVVRKGRPSRMVALLWVLIVAPAILRVLSALLHHGRFQYTFVHCDGLAWGALLALLAYRARVPFHSLNARDLWKRCGRPMFWGGMAGSFVAFATERRFGYFGQALTASGPLFAGTLLYLLTHQSVLTKILSSRPMRYLGEVSYMFYLSHLYVLYIYDKHLQRWVPRAPAAALYQRFFFVLVVTLLFCTASLYCFERPIGRLRQYKLRSE